MRSRYVVIVLIVGLMGCSKDSSSTAPTEMSTIELAWKDFEEQRYDSAIPNFTDAYNNAPTDAIRAEAVGGRAWSYAYKRDLAKAKSDFILAQGITGVTRDVQNDVRAGYAFLLYALNDFTQAISYSSAVLMENPAYSFPHDPRVTTRRVRLLLVQSYYANGQFVSAASQMDVVNPSAAPHSSDPVILLGKILAALNSL